MQKIVDTLMDFKYKAAREYYGRLKENFYEEKLVVNTFMSIRWYEGKLRYSNQRSVSLMNGRSIITKEMNTGSLFLS
jgi:hypothetical protein